jgi:hypothetical protein
VAAVIVRGVFEMTGNHVVVENRIGLARSPRGARLRNE